MAQTVEEAYQVGQNGANLRFLRLKMVPTIGVEPTPP